MSELLSWTHWHWALKIDDSVWKMHKKFEKRKKYTWNWLLSPFILYRIQFKSYFREFYRAFSSEPNFFYIIKQSNAIPSFEIFILLDQSEHVSTCEQISKLLKKLMNYFLRTNVRYFFFCSFKAMLSFSLSFSQFQTN